MESPVKVIHWTSKLEELFKETAERAYCYSWLHKKSEEVYSFRTVWTDLPVIIIGGLAGACSVGSDSLFGGSQYASVGIGAIVLLNSIISTVGSYFSFAKRAEGHRIASISYNKLHRFIATELSLPRLERISPQDLLKFCSNEQNRLLELSPLIPPQVVDLFKKRFSDAKYEKIAKPSESNGLEEVEVYEAVDDLPSPAGGSLKPNVVVVSD